MSVIGSQLLTELVELRQVYSPDKILNEMHRQVRRILKQDQSDSRDGMDIQLIRWQKDQQTLQFAGAMTPCYCLTLANGQLLEIRADRKAIGGEQAEEERLFTLQEIEVTSPTLLYLCTDGYQDQFGGPKGKKFMSSQLKTLLASLADQPLKDQETILAHTIEDWRALGNEQQVDDITIVGLRIG
jgi:serine phosphatase RsbU (regulator of sigma subunit)